MVNNERKSLPIEAFLKSLQAYLGKAACIIQFCQVPNMEMKIRRDGLLLEYALGACSAGIVLALHLVAMS